MSRRKKDQQRPWQQLQRAAKIPPSARQMAALRAEAEAVGFDPEAAVRIAAEDKEMWKNDRYTVVARRHPDGWVTQLSVRRNDRGPDVPWRHLQRIKTEIAGAEAEAIELFPAESRLIDTANQRWLWCIEPGIKLPVGFDDGRHVSGPRDAIRFGAVQAPLDE